MNVHSTAQWRLYIIDVNAKRAIIHDTDKLLAQIREECLAAVQLFAPTRAEGDEFLLYVQSIGQGIKEGAVAFNRERNKGLKRAIQAVKVEHSGHGVNLQYSVYVLLYHRK